jgi:exosortase D (VPLPA-CTERM-specific)
VSGLLEQAAPRAGPADAPGGGGRPVPLVPLAAALVLGAVAFRPGVTDMVERWTATDSYYGHGPLIPLVSGWLVWRERAALARIPRGSSALGLAAVAAAVAVLAFSLLEDIHFTQNFALVLAIAGVALTLLGAPLVRATWFALAYLCVAVPLPQMVVANLTFSLKMLAAQLSVAAISAAGFPVVLDGATIHLASTSVTVEDVCSGLRTMVALVALSLIFAYFERSRWKAALTLALAVPIAIVANIVRILILCVFSAYGLRAAHEGPGHEATGLAVFAVALLLLSGIRSLPGGAPGGEGSGDAPRPSPAPAAPAPPVVHGGPSGARTAALLVLLGLGAAAALALSGGAAAAEKTERTRAIPAAIAGWTGDDIPLSRRTFELLETEDVLMRTFRRGGLAAPVDLYVIHAADSRKVAHPPEMCFSGGGYVARESGVAALEVGGRPVPANRMLLARGRSTLLVYYWYRLDGRDTAGYLDHQLEHLLRKLRRERREGSMIRLSTPVGADGIRAAEARLATFAREVMPGVLAVLP